MEHILAKLEELAEIRAATAVTREAYDARRAEVLRAVQAELDALAEEYEPLLAVAAEREQALETEIRASVAEAGASVKGSRLQAVYVRGRTTWDTRGLERYAADHPEVNDFRRQGAPSVSLRVVK